jgi:baseplate hub protein gp41
MSAAQSAPVPPTNYAKRKIDLSLKYVGEPEVTLRGLRVITQVHMSGMPNHITADVRIYGMALSLMNKLSTLGKIAGRYERNNIVSISAGDVGKPPALIFTGTIQEAWADFGGAPEVFFTIQAHSGLADRMKPVPPTSYAGAVDAATIMQTMATAMGRKFENNGVHAILPNAYYPGTMLDQLEKCAQAVPCNLLDDGTTVAIWPIDGSRAGPITKLSPATGLIGYPSYTGAGVAFRTLYNPEIFFGCTVDIDSSVTPAKGKWVVNVLTHNLQSEMPGGEWFTDMEGYRFGESPTVPG